MQRDIGQAWELRQSAQYVRLGALLTGLLHDTAAWLNASGDDRQTAEAAIARMGEAAQAWEFLGHAKAAAVLIGHERADLFAVFGPVNLAVHGVQVATDLGDGREALRRAEKVDVGQMPPVLLERRSTLLIDIVRSQHMRRDHAAAGETLLEAERIAPLEVRYNGIAHRLLERAAGRQPGVGRAARDGHQTSRGSMTAARRRPVLYVIACGGRPAADLPAFITWAQDQGWDACVITTPAGTQFVDADRLAGLTGHPVRDDYKRPEDPDVLPFPPDAFVVAPATFNTINKWANGISDTLALGLLNEGLAAGQPIAAVPNPNITLAKHPAFIRSIAFLRESGVHVLFDPDTYPLPTPNLGEASRDMFPWEALKSVVQDMQKQVR